MRREIILARVFDVDDPLLRQKRVFQYVHLISGDGSHRENHLPADKDASSAVRLCVVPLRCACSQRGWQDAVRRSLVDFLGWKNIAQLAFAQQPVWLRKEGRSQ